MEHDIQSDGVTVWVNTAVECIGRFGQMGIDIHTTIESQMKGGPQCLECTHGPVTTADWERFKTAMLEHYGVAVSDEHRPVRFLEMKPIEQWETLVIRSEEFWPPRKRESWE